MKELIAKKKALSAELIEKMKEDDKDAVVEKMAEISKIDEEIEAKAGEQTTPTDTDPDNGAGGSNGDGAGEGESEEVKKTKETITKAVEVEVKKYADMYISGEDFKKLIEDIIAGSAHFKDLITKVDAVEKFANTEKPSKQLEPQKKTTDTFDGMFGGTQ